MTGFKSLNLIRKDIKMDCGDRALEGGFPQAGKNGDFRSTSRPQRAGPVDNALPPVGSVCCASHQEPTAVGPGWCWNTARGLADQKGTDRLVSTVTPRLDSAPPALCPTCGAASDTARSRVRRAGVILTAHYICTAQHVRHVWLERWTELSGRD